MKLEEIKTFKQLFEDFRAKCIPANAPEQQRRTMEMCFYAGLGTMLKMELDIAELPSNDEGALAFQRLHAEFREWQDGWMEWAFKGGRPN